jgi:hypothetical protein
MNKGDKLNLYDKFLWYNIFKLMKRMGFIYSDIKCDNKDMVEALTFSNNAEYIDRVGKIE